ncbi:DUF2147 domain-containing protein [Pinisolibacter aquiterrae]|uniref:DUF2147 domain-containing protein n=1 Tax=Pinisolibacter aquiterrae TaxID=2815579 RepID=UPI001C3CAABC|nr:DUF2147 domain-containing protein [Pinisolibacter aquiterrae]MBV5264305.1 DUF2147 domain-containing protein [Pinisolibacter aquiterrae]MCC8234546.1 DUF2147 domain-containing protein [Pinisolibacter aquiterrae]
MTYKVWAAAMGVLLLAAGSASAGEATGVWMRSSGTSKIRIDKCGAALCGTVVWEKSPRKDIYNPDAAKRDEPITGRRILLGMKPSGEDKWKGEVYNAEDGKTYTGYITLTAPDQLKLQGCVLGGLICKSDTWSRAR